jgi:hypothetical protein
LMSTVALRAASSGLPRLAAEDWGSELGSVAVSCGLETDVALSTGVLPLGAASFAGVAPRQCMKASTRVAVSTAVTTIAPGPSPESCGEPVARPAVRGAVDAGRDCNLAKYTPHDSHLTVSSCRWPHLGQSILGLYRPSSRGTSVHLSISVAIFGDTPAFKPAYMDTDLCMRRPPSPQPAAALQ